MYCSTRLCKTLKVSAPLIYGRHCTTATFRERERSKDFLTKREKQRCWHSLMHPIYIGFIKLETCRPMPNAATIFPQLQATNGNEETGLSWTNTMQPLAMFSMLIPVFLMLQMSAFGVPINHPHSISILWVRPSRSLFQHAGELRFLSDLCQFYCTL